MAQQIENSCDWEDGDLLCKAFEPAGSGASFVTTHSCGDNALALLTLNPERVVVADENPASLALIELKKTAFKALDYQKLLQFLGVTEGGGRFTAYLDIRDRLPEEAAFFWDARPRLIEEGIIHAGKKEQRIRRYAKWIFPWIHSKWKREEILKERTEEQRTAFYDAYWNTWLWKQYMRRLEPFPAKTDIFLARRLRHIFTTLSTHDNPYLIYELTGNFTPQALPRYLQQEHFEQIKEGCSRVKTFKGPVSEVEGKFNGFHLSTKSEQDPWDWEFIYRSILERSHYDSRLIYWNEGKPRGMPETLQEYAAPNPELAKLLFAYDKVWRKTALHIDEILLPL